jgi:phosphoribosylformylglycinamidine synthase subunit PurL
VTGGNVSLYNENPGGAIDPTPTVGMVGLLHDVSLRVASHFKTPGHRIVLLGENHGHLGGSSYWEVVHDFVGGSPPAADLSAEHRLQRCLVAAADRQLVQSAHDCSDGGLGVALAEACIGGPYAPTTFGAAVQLREATELSPEALLYGEDAGRVIVSCEAGAVQALVALAGQHGVHAEEIGSVGGAGGTLEVGLEGRGIRFTWETRELRRIYHDAIPRRMRSGV